MNEPPLPGTRALAGPRLTPIDLLGLARIRAVVHARHGQRQKRLTQTNVCNVEARRLERKVGPIDMARGSNHYGEPARVVKRAISLEDKHGGSSGVAAGLRLSGPRPHR